MLFHLQVHYYFICWSNESFGWKIINYKSIHSFPWTVQAILFVNNFYIVIMERFPLVNWLFNTPYWFYLRKSANEKYVPNVCCYCLLNKWDNEKKNWLVVIGIDPLERRILQNEDLCLFSVFDKFHLYHFRNKEIIPFLGKEKQTEKVRHLWQRHMAILCNLPFFKNAP